MLIHEWATRHRIPRAAIADLLQLMGAHGRTDEQISGSVTNEIAVQNALRSNMSRQGGRLWRNNVGAGTLANGSYIRWGIANDSPALNRVVKSSDLIGIRPRTIAPEHVGLVIGQFVAREAKRPGWCYTDTAHERAQLAFIQLINALGGDARFANSGDEI